MYLLKIVMYVEKIIFQELPEGVMNVEPVTVKQDMLVTKNVNAVLIVVGMNKISNV